MVEQVPRWCKEMHESSTSDLHRSALIFVKSLNLSTLHPSCKLIRMGRTLSLETVAPQDYVDYDQDNEFTSWIFSLSDISLKSTAELIVTFYWNVAPPLLAMAELWLRLFAFILAPLCISYLVSIEMGTNLLKVGQLAGKGEGQEGKFAGKTKAKVGGKYEKRASLLGLASSAVIFTDSLYVYEYGQSYGCTLFIAMVLLSVRTYMRMRITNRSEKKNTASAVVAYRSTALMIILCVLSCLISSHPCFQKADDFNLFRYLIQSQLKMGPSTSNCWACNHGYNLDYGSGLDLPTIEPGFYYDDTNPIMKKLAEHWPEQNRRYEISNGGDATPWLVTGDSRTGIPFLINSIDPIEGFRLWVPSHVDQEANAIDIFFPEDGVHRIDKPIYLVFHGLNGGSDEEYIKDFIHRRRKEGSTVAVLIARGLMQTPVVGWNVFHGARTGDIDAASKAMRRGLAPKQILVGVGYSMGAIVLSNYVARSGKKCHLDGAVAISGGLNMVEQITFYRSMRLWQPMLAQELRDTIFQGYKQRYKARLSTQEYLEFMRSTNIAAIDRYAVVRYNQFQDLTHYYSEMSAMGETNATNPTNRISNVAVPFLVIHGLDDPLITWRTLGDPEQVVKSGSGYIMMLLTKAGGHVGWPLGINPKKDAWKWMNDCANDFAISLDYAKKNK